MLFDFDGTILARAAVDQTSRVGAERCRGVP
jgi:hypothetical protein